MPSRAILAGLLLCAASPLRAEAARFEQKVARWSGPEDDVGGARPYARPQELFAVRDRERLSRADLETVLAGTMLVLPSPRGTEYVLRDHHMVDVALLHYATTGELPTALFHADRHSDWARDGYLEARRPEQAATWWTLVQGVKRPDGTPWLAEGDVHFAWAQAPHEPWMSGRRIAEDVHAVVAQMIQQGKPR